MKVAVSSHCHLCSCRFLVGLILCHISEESTLHSHHCENLKSYMTPFSLVIHLYKFHNTTSVPTKHILEILRTDTELHIFKFSFVAMHLMCSIHTYYMPVKGLSTCIIREESPWPGVPYETCRARRANSCE
jgi:hypothetical protein